MRAADRAGCARPSWGHETASEESPERGKAAISGKQSLSEARVPLRVRVRRSAQGVREKGRSELLLRRPLSREAAFVTLWS